MDGKNIYLTAVCMKTTLAGRIQKNDVSDLITFYYVLIQSTLFACM